MPRVRTKRPSSITFRNVPVTMLSCETYRFTQPFFSEGKRRDSGKSLSTSHGVARERHVVRRSPLVAEEVLHIVDVTKELLAPRNSWRSVLTPRRARRPSPLPAPVWFYASPMDSAVTWVAIGPSRARSRGLAFSSVARDRAPESTPNYARGTFPLMSSLHTSVTDGSRIGRRGHVQLLPLGVPMGDHIGGQLGDPVRTPPPMVEKEAAQTACRGIRWYPRLACPHAGRHIGAGRVVALSPPTRGHGSTVPPSPHSPFLLFVTFLTLRRVVARISLYRLPPAGADARPDR